MIDNIPGNIKIMVTELPATIHGCITELEKGRYLILLNSRDDEARRQQALAHEMQHYYNNDFDAGKSINEIEAAAHRYTGA